MSRENIIFEKGRNHMVQSTSIYRHIGSRIVISLPKALPFYIQILVEPVKSADNAPHIELASRLSGQKYSRLSRITGYGATGFTG